ncbi:amino acid transporter/nucleotide-binding universal stress UspA family protein [Methanohalophilus levihalophilus]|uniref:amino acid permease n=1 Tax=Methanohalophilus levihalophilus TaxID=1431282 RepID=UPI001AE4384F|nr:amino acid permease [Methanohalophilus levihalophilus]MBP2030903.1 amino acid transporter/nucleotide-binding universal stress UspA family protein [Methanohalophilus levihalophilus]
MATIETKERLGRSLGFFATFAIGTGTMIGAGIFILPAIATANAGPAAIISFLLGGVISMATAISMAELATGMPRAGGSYHFISRAMGAGFGVVVGFGAWLALMFKGSFALIGLADYFQVFYNLPIYFVAVATGLILLFINYRGAKSSGTLQNIIVVFLLLILGLFIIKGIFILDMEKFTPVVPFGYSSILATTGLIFISFLGITQLAAISEEVKNPSKNLPRAFISSVAVVTLIYVGVMVVINGTLNLEESVNTNTPLVDVADLMAGNLGKVAIGIAGILATLSTANAAILSSSRFPFAMGRDSLVPQWFMAIHKKFETPSRAILTTGVVMILLLLLFDVEQLAKLGSTFNILIFVLINISVIILRKRHLEGYEPAFRDPFFPLTQIFGIFGSLILLPLLGLLPLFFVLFVVFVGLFWYTFYCKGTAAPGYSLFDMLEDRVSAPSIIPESMIKVLVPISNPRHERDLLNLADWLGDDIIGLHVAKVPQQTSLNAAQEAYHKRGKEIKHLLQEEFEQFPALSGHKREFIIAFDHSVSNSIVEQANMENVDIIVMGWHGHNRFSYSLGDVTNEVLSFSKSHIILLKGYLPEKIKRIVVTYDGKDNSSYGVYLAKKLAISTGASIQVVNIAHPEKEPIDKSKLIADLNKIIGDDDRVFVTYEFIERFSIADGILEFGNNGDLLIIGDSGQRFKVSLLGKLSQKITKHSASPVLIVRTAKPISREGLTYWIRKKL